MARDLNPTLRGTAAHLRYSPAVLAVLVGVVFLLVGWSVFESSEPWDLVLIGAGGSLIAASVYAFLSVARDNFVNTVLRMGIRDLFDDRYKDLGDSEWEPYLQGAKDHYKILGVANHGYLHSESSKQRYGGLFQSAARRDVEVELLWLKPDSILAAIRDEEEGRASRADAIKSMRWFWELRGELDPAHQNNFSLKEYELTPTCGITWIDDEIVVTHYLAKKLNLHAPGLIITTRPGWWPWARPAVFGRETDLGRKYSDNYTEIAQSAQPLTAERIEELEMTLARVDVGPSESDFREPMGDQPGDE